MSASDSRRSNARRFREPWPWSRWLRGKARAAIERHYGVPYLHELSRAEHRGMLLLEDQGEVERDYGLGGDGELHWHRRVVGR